MLPCTPKAIAHHIEVTTSSAVPGGPSRETGVSQRLSLYAFLVTVSALGVRLGMASLF